MSCYPELGAVVEQERTHTAVCALSHEPHGDSPSALRTSGKQLMRLRKTMCEAVSKSKKISICANSCARRPLKVVWVAKSKNHVQGALDK